MTLHTVNAWIENFFNWKFSGEFYVCPLYDTQYSIRFLFSITYTHITNTPKTQLAAIQIILGAAVCCNSRFELLWSISLTTNGLWMRTNDISFEWNGWHTLLFLIYQRESRFFFNEKKKIKILREKSTEFLYKIQTKNSMKITILLQWIWSQTKWESWHHLTHSSDYIITSSNHVSRIYDIMWARPWFLKIVAPSERIHVANAQSWIKIEHFLFRADMIRSSVTFVQV